MTFEDIQRANAQIVTTNIKGKEYAEVNQRIKAFRMVYPEGFIKTELVTLEDGVCVMKGAAGFYDENGNERLLAEAWAYEKETSSYINKTSFIENCCTSVTGRVLGKCGYGIDTSVASYEEVANAQANQNITRKEWKNIQALCKARGVDVMELIGSYGYEKPTDITGADYLKMIKEVSNE